MLNRPLPFRRFVAATAVGLLALAAASSAWAQDRLPSSILNASSLSSSQEREIESFVSRWNTQLLQGNDQEVADAREALLQPVRSSTSEPFLDGYGEAVGERLSTALEARRLITRLNAMIVVGELGGRGVRGAIVKGLGDPSPAVNYWAASGVVKLAEASEQGTSIPSSAVRNILDAMSDMLEANEGSNQLLYPSLRAAVTLDVPQGDELFLDSLESRIDLHASQPLLDYGPALQKRAWPRLIQRSISSSAEADRDVLRQSARIAARYFALIARQLEEGELGTRPPQSHLDMMQWCQRLLATVNRTVDGPSSVPDSIEVRNAIENLNANFLRLSASTWIATMKKRPYAFAPEELEVPQP